MSEGVTRAREKTGPPKGQSLSHGRSGGRANGCMDERPSIDYVPGFLKPEEATHLLDTFIKDLSWHQPRVFIYGRWVDSPRLAAWYGDSGATYRYSGMMNDPLPWTDELLQLRSKVEKFCGHYFNSVLANLYRDGADSMGWHSDDEKELGPRPVIASISLGSARRFLLRHRKKKSASHEWLLEHGSLLVMREGVQSQWRHSVPKTAKPLAPRINLTFRQVLDRSA